MNSINPQGGKYFDTQKEIKRLLSQAWRIKLEREFVYYTPDAIQIIIVNNPNIQN
jgi:hypothetical protein